jgi:hypothetical protein
LIGRLWDAVALTARGAEYLDEDQIAAKCWTIMLVAEIDEEIEPGGRFSSAQLLVSALRREGEYGKVVALGAPTQSPPVATTGVFSDANAHFEVVGRSAGAMRLFIDQNAGVYSTNMKEHIDRFLAAELPFPTHIS